MQSRVENENLIPIIVKETITSWAMREGGGMAGWQVKESQLWHLFNSFKHFLLF